MFHQLRDDGARLVAGAPRARSVSDGDHGVRLDDEEAFLREPAWPSYLRQAIMSLRVSMPLPDQRYVDRMLALDAQRPYQSFDYTHADDVAASQRRYNEAMTDAQKMADEREASEPKMVERPKDIRELGQFIIGWCFDEHMEFEAKKGPIKDTFNIWHNEGRPQ